MVCRFVDSFDYYSTSEIFRKWTNLQLAITSIDTVNQRTGTGALRMAGTQSFVSLTIDDQASWVVGFAFRTSGFNDQAFFIFVDDVVSQCVLRMNNDGTLEVLRGASSVSGGVSTATLTLNTYVYIEMKVTISNSIAADSCIVRVDGDDVINVDAGEDLQVSANATSDRFRLSNQVNSIEVLFDDLYIFDQTGSENNDFIGDAFVAAQFPDGNGTTNDFNGSDGNSVDNYLLVDENPTDDDVTYTESSTPGDIDLYTFDNITGSANIKAIQINNVTRKSDTGGRTMRSVTRPASTNFFGTSRAPSAASYFNEREILDQNPETSADWTKQNFNATEFGIEIEA